MSSPYAHPMSHFNSNDNDPNNGRPYDVNQLSTGLYLNSGSQQQRRENHSKATDMDTFFHHSPQDAFSSPQKHLFHPQLELANQYLQESAYEKALQCFLRILQHDPRHDEAIRGVRFIMSRDTFSAQEKYRNIVNRLEKVIRGLTIHQQVEEQQSGQQQMNGGGRQEEYTSGDGNIYRSQRSMMNGSANGHFAANRSISTDQWMNDSSSNVSTISTGGADSFQQQNHGDNRRYLPQNDVYTNNFINSPPASPGQFYRGDQSSVPSPLSLGGSVERTSMPSPLFMHSASNSAPYYNKNHEHPHQHPSNPRHAQSWNATQFHSSSADPTHNGGPHSHNLPQRANSQHFMRTGIAPDHSPPMRRKKRKTSAKRNSSKRNPSPKKSASRARPKRAKRGNSKSPSKRQSKRSTSRKKHPYLPSYMQDLPEMEQLFAVERASRAESASKRRTSRNTSRQASSAVFHSAIKVCEMSQCENPAIGNSDSHVVLYCNAQHKTMMHSECWHFYNRDSSTNVEGNQISCPLSWCQEAVSKVIMKLPQHEHQDNGNDPSSDAFSSIGRIRLDSGRLSSRPSSAKRAGSAKQKRPSSAPHRKSLLEDADIIAQGSPTKMLRPSSSMSRNGSSSGRSPKSTSGRRRSPAKKLVHKDSEINNLKSLIDGKEDQIQQLKYELNELKVSLKDLPKKLSALQTMRIRSNSPRSIDQIKSRDSLGEIRPEEIAAMLDAERRESVPGKGDEQDEMRGGETPALQGSDDAQRTSTPGVISVHITPRSMSLPEADDTQFSSSPRGVASRAPSGLAIDTNTQRTPEHSTTHFLRADSNSMLISPKDILTPEKSPLGVGSPAGIPTQQPVSEDEFSPANIRKPPSSVSPTRKSTSPSQIQQIEHPPGMSQDDAALTIQTVARGHLARRTANRRRVAQQHFQTQQVAATLIQSAARGFISRKRVYQEKQRNEAATTIQKNFKRFSAQQTAEQIKRLHEEQAATTIQLSFRRFQALKQLSLAEAARGRENDAARVLQHSMRAYIASKQAKAEREKLNALRHAKSVIIQNCYRAHQAKRQLDERRTQFEAQQEKEDNQYFAAVTIQSAYRGHGARRIVSEKKFERSIKLREDSENTPHPQSLEEEDHDSLEPDFAPEEFESESFVEVDSDPEHLNNAALKIQSHFRGYQDRKKTRFMSQNHEEALLRAEALEFENASAAVIQKNYRGYKGRRQVAQLKRGDVVGEGPNELERPQQQENVQEEVELLKREYNAALTIQSSFRRHSAHKSVVQRRQEIEAQQQQRDNAALAIQSTYRRHSASKTVSQRKQEVEAQQQRRVDAALAIQSTYRRHSAHKSVAQRRQEIETQQLQRDDAALAIQSTYRRHSAHKSVAQRKQEIEAQQRHAEAALRIQRQFRGFQDRRQVQSLQQEQQAQLILEEELEKQNASAVVIQKSFRGYKERQQVEQVRETFSPPALEAATSFEDIEQREAAVLTMQRSARGFLARRRAEAQRQQMNNQLERLSEEENSAITIQRSFRGYQDRQRAQELLQERKSSQQLIPSDELIISDTHPSDLKQQEDKAIVIQNCVRSFLARKIVSTRRQTYLHEEDKLLQHEMRIKEERSAEVLQNCARRFLALRRVQRIRQHQKESLADLEQRENSALAIQRHYRGYRERSRVDEVRRNVQTEQDAKAREENSAIVIQTSYRGFQDRRRVADLRAARGVSGKQDNADSSADGQQSSADLRTLPQDDSLLKSALAIQRQYRRFKALDIIEALKESQREELQNLINAENAASKIQKAFRFFTSRKQRENLQKSLAQEETAAISIQRVARGHFARKTASVAKENVAAKDIQRAWRGFQGRQRVTKAKTTQMYSQKSVVIQASWKSYKGRESFLHKVELVNWVQNQLRGNLVARRFASRDAAASQIQNAFRSWLSEKGK
eukprot:CAMPEP_0117439908 /NCGR_PEP_ID=MMETSP0759-20121206/2804_1 /TAXON_ID=63605 /ORGANISM="Percolomonas cosmopolitus, Strain WS" /LENGTH=1911 /DNA_ID=CAMNT_0005231631 /DNA_START=429 /DNA_END=6164 /DNA_ORIENTATION=+